MKLSTILSIAALLFALLLAFLLLSKEGGCDRDGGDDDDMEPACMPGDKECHAGKPAPPSAPPIGGAK